MIIMQEALMNIQLKILFDLLYFNLKKLQL